ncbi:protein DEK-like isoform X2 [Oncorhynchus keta]|uniref:protein DEK-like isoform X2 n=1 Tax=Oncorhynchus keta TaxID=8018 RepID=UPI0015F8CE5E|nr:protein DEK-like isoform X2 [Oncorhynchus keta]
MTEAMDEKVCPLSDEVEKEPKVEDLADSPEKAQKPRNEMSRDITLSQIVEGKREKKMVQRLDFQVAKPAKVLKVENGGGDKLRDIARVNHHLGKLKVPDLKPLHTILFDMPGKIATMRKNMRLFNGFLFEVDSEPYIKKKERMMKITCVRLRTICKVLDLEKGGNQSVLIDRIMTFLMSPRISGKPVISKRKKKSKKNISTKDSKSKTKAKSISSSPRKVKAESKSKAIVTDSSSDEDDDDDDDDEQGVTVEQDESDAEKKSEKAGKREKVTTDEDTDDSEDYDDEDPKSNPAAKGKRTPAKKRAQPAKKAAPAKKKTKDSDQSESDSDKDDEDEKDSESEVEKPKKKPSAKRAALAKTKKADSSSNKQKKTANKGNALDSSDDDEPLIKMIKKPPTDEQLKETVKRLLKDANLEEMTMKKICQKVYDTYPEYDLTSRKDYVKQTVKTLIS